MDTKGMKRSKEILRAYSSAAGLILKACPRVRKLGIECIAVPVAWFERLAKEIEVKK